MAGVVPLTSGQIFLDGKEVKPATPNDAHHLGIAMVFQENSLVPTMSVAQNLLLGNERYFNRTRGINIEAPKQFLQSLQFDVEPGSIVSQLGAAKKQMVEIARAVLNKAKVIIFDEPTAKLTPEEKQHFFNLVRELKGRGVSIIFISHALEEALMLSDRITVLRDAKHVVTDDTANFDQARIVKAMVGRDISQTVYGQRKTSVRPAGKRVLSVQNLRMASYGREEQFLLGVLPGRSLASSAWSAPAARRRSRWSPACSSATWCTAARSYSMARPGATMYQRARVRDGFAYITEDRKLEGFFETKSIGLEHLSRPARESPRRKEPHLRPPGERDRRDMDQTAETSAPSAKT